MRTPIAGKVAEEQQPRAAYVPYPLMRATSVQCLETIVDYSAYSLAYSKKFSYSGKTGSLGAVSLLPAVEDLLAEFRQVKCVEPERVRRRAFSSGGSFAPHAQGLTPKLSEGTSADEMR